MFLLFRRQTEIDSAKTEECLPICYFSHCLLMEKRLLQNRKIISEHCQQVLMVHHDQAERLTLYYKQDERSSSSCSTV